jgi:hypothetical protein
MRIVDALSRLMNWLSGEKPSATFTTNEVNKALLDDAPRVVRDLMGHFRLLYCDDRLGFAGRD